MVWLKRIISKTYKNMRQNNRYEKGIIYQGLLVDGHIYSNVPFCISSVKQQIMAWDAKPMVQTWVYLGDAWHHQLHCCQSAIWPY